MACPHAERCAIVPVLDSRKALAVWKTLFCDSGFTRCVRFRLATAGATVPDELLPDGRTRLQPGPGTPRA